MKEGNIFPTGNKCRRCNGELTLDEKRGCKVCLVCYPPNASIPEPPKKKALIDVEITEKRVEEIVEAKLNEERIRETVRDELENWHIQKPPVTRDEIPEEETAPAPLTWRQQAKELGIELFHRKKEDVLKEIESRMKG